MLEPLPPSIFDQILARMNAQGEFISSVLVSEQGWPVAEAPPGSTTDSTTLAAMVTLVKGFIQETQQQLGLARVDEVSTVARDRKRLICRYFSMQGKWFVLAIIAQPNQNHRRLTTRAIREMSAAWDL